MANYNSLKATIDAQIKANGVQAITGPILNAVLTAMINTIGNGYSLQGSVAQTTDNPGAPDNPVAYLAAGPGTYTNFGGTVIPDDGHAYLLKWDTVWTAVQLPLPTYDLANGKQDALTFDDNPTPGSDNPVKSNGIAEALDTKQDKDTGDTAGHVAVMDGNGNSVDGGEALADLATKSELAVLAGEAGLAEAVIDTDNAGTEQEFTFRKSGGDGGAYYRRILGRSLAWNQLADIPHLVATGDAGYTKFPCTDIEIIAGHNYLFMLSNWTNINGVRLRVPEISVDYTQDFIITPSTSGTGYFQYIGENGGSIDAYYAIVDLTLMFGAGNEPNSVAEFKALYPDIYPNNPGTLISNDAEAVETTGVNQWDEEWENGTIAVANGQNEPSPDIRCKGYIRVEPGKTYYFRVGNTQYVDTYLYFYDSNKNYSNIYVNPKNATFTVPDGMYYVRFTLYNVSYGYGGTYRNDICINLSDAAINGQYFPYWKRTLQLGLTTKEDTDGNVPFADGMKGAGTASDWADKVGGEKRMGRVDLGTLEYVYGEGGYFYFTAPGIETGGAPVICSKYATETERDIDKSIWYNGSYYGTSTLCIKDSAYSDAATFKAAMQGVMLDYPLATPVPFTWAEPLNLGVKVDENGAERAVAPEGATAPSAPFVADTTYTMSIARMVAILQGI